HVRLGGYLRATGGGGAFAQDEAAVRLGPARPPPAERAQVLAAFGEALITQARFRESRELCEEAIAIAGQIGALVEGGEPPRALGGGPPAGRWGGAWRSSAPARGVSGSSPRPTGSSRRSARSTRWRAPSPPG